MLSEFTEWKLHTIHTMYADGIADVQILHRLREVVILSQVDLFLARGTRA